MAQQAIRRARRSRGKDRALWQGLAVAVGFTVAAVIVFALIIGLTNPTDGMIGIVNQLIKVAAVFLGVWYIVPKGADNGPRQGALLGLIYMVAGVAVYALLSGQQITLLGFLIDGLMGVAAGGLMGMLLGSMQSK